METNRGGGYAPTWGLLECLLSMMMMMMMVMMTDLLSADDL